MKELKKHFPTILFILVVVLSFFLLRPFITAIISAFVFAYIFYPLYKWFKKRMNDNWSALITLIIIILIITIPVAFVVNAFVQESFSVYQSAKTSLGAGFEICKMDSPFCDLLKTIEEEVIGVDFKTFLSNNFDKLSSVIVSKSSEFVFGLAGKILNFFIFLFITFFMLRDGRKLAKWVGSLLLMRTDHKKRALKDIKDLIYATVFGTIIIALIQGSVAAIGYLIFGVSNPVLWGIITMFAAFIPFVGTTIVWVPAGIILLVMGVLGQQSMIWRGVGLLIYGAAVISTIDNFIRPKIIGDRSILHPVLVLLGVAGGLRLSILPYIFWEWVL